MTATPPPNRLAKRSEASTAALLRVARRVFGERGYAGTSLEQIAADTSMTKGAVYHHFGSKEALFEEVFRREHRAMIALVATKSQGVASPVDAILRGIRVYLHAILDPTLRRILLQDGPAVLGWERWRRCEKPGFDEMLQASLGAAAHQDLLRPGVRPAETAVLLLGAVTESALAVAHASDPAASARRFARELALHVGALCR